MKKGLCLSERQLFSGMDIHQNETQLLLIGCAERYCKLLLVIKFTEFLGFIEINCTRFNRISIFKEYFSCNMSQFMERKPAKLIKYS